MMHKQLITLLVFTATTLTVHAQSRIDSWTAEGGAWDAQRQSNYTESGGYLINDAGSTDVRLSIIPVFPATGYSVLTAGSGAYGANAMSIQAFTLQVNNALANLQTVTLTVKGLLPSSPSFTFNSPTLENGLMKTAATTRLWPAVATSSVDKPVTSIPSVGI